MGFLSKLFGKKDDAATSAPDTALEAAVETPTVAEADAAAPADDHSHDHDHDHEGHDHTH